MTALYATLYVSGVIGAEANSVKYTNTATSRAGVQKFWIVITGRTIHGQRTQMSRIHLTLDVADGRTAVVPSYHYTLQIGCLSYFGQSPNVCLGALHDVLFLGGELIVIQLL